MGTGLYGLAHECNNILNEIEILEVTNNNVFTKRKIKSTVQKTIMEGKKREILLSFRKVADRVSMLVDTTKGRLEKKIVKISNRR